LGGTRSRHRPGRGLRRGRLRPDGGLRRNRRRGGPGILTAAGRSAGNPDRLTCRVEGREPLYNRLGAANLVDEAAAIRCRLRRIFDFGAQSTLTAECGFGTGRKLEDEAAGADGDVERVVAVQDQWGL